MSDTSDEYGQVRPGYQCLAYISVALAMLGAALPLLPTTPFLLLAAWSAQRGSPRVAAWLARHGVFGPMIENWRERGAVSGTAKGLACVLMTTSLVMVWFTSGSVWLVSGLGVLFCLVAGFLLTRPSQ